ncbi:hypothetical protein [Lactococcus garvieae]|uniref:hypothetical protein n=3 Tax=Lactococcus garvieae TaxID=1363 RepID=UPI0025511F4F|nr:hypothetical protein [Lactococcus garvieae]
MYKIKVVKFDDETHVRQATLREIRETNFKNGKSTIYEKNIIEIFGKSVSQIKQAFVNNGINFYDSNQKNKQEEFNSEFFVEIGNSQIFKYTHFYNINQLEEMIVKYDYKLIDLIQEKPAVYLIHNEQEYMTKYPKVYEGILKLFNTPQIFIFLTEDNTSGILSQIERQIFEALSYEYIIHLWKGWKIETLTLERIYQCLHFNVMV